MGNKALIIVDMQNGFIPGDDPNVHGLPVAGGDEIILGINKLQEQFDCVVATKDWHPQNHGSFASQHPDKQPFDVTLLDGIEQIIWPDHCIQNTQGAEFVSGLNTDKISHVTYKGCDPRIDSYSGFKDNQANTQTDLDAYLKSQNISSIFLVGLAGDVCVKATAIDGAALGYQTYFIADLTRNVDTTSQNEQALKQELTAAGVSVIASDELVAQGLVS